MYNVTLGTFCLETFRIKFTAICRCFHNFEASKIVHFHKTGHEFKLHIHVGRPTLVPSRIHLTSTNVQFNIFLALRNQCAKASTHFPEQFV